MNEVTEKPPSKQAGEKQTQQENRERGWNKALH
jgi:hypothetical protein